MKTFLACRPITKNRVWVSLNFRHTYAREDSPPRRGGVDARRIRRCEATLFRADGVVSSAHQLQGGAGLTTPAAPQRRLRNIFIDVAATPPLRGGESCLFSNRPTTRSRNSLTAQCVRRIVPKTSRRTSAVARSLN